MKKLLILFVRSFFIILPALCIVNIAALTVDCIFNGFASYGERLAGLPYLAYAIISLLITAVLTTVIGIRTK